MKVLSDKPIYGSWSKSQLIEIWTHWIIMFSEFLE